MVTLKGLLDRTQVRPALCLCLGVLLYAPPSDSQELQFRATDAGPAFDVTSIKVAPGDTPFEGIKSLPGGLVRTRRTTAYDLILAAFGINRNRLVSQFPDWLTQESYSVEARATNQAVLTREEVGARLRSMLAARGRSPKFVKTVRSRTFRLAW